MKSNSGAGTIEPDTTKAAEAAKTERLQMLRLAKVQADQAATESIRKLTHKQVRAARDFLGWSRVTLGARVGVSVTWVARYETNGLTAASAGRVTSVVAALQAAGVIYETEDGDGPGVRLRKAL